MSTTKTLQATIPFSGFYESHHVAAIEDAISQMFYSEDTNDYNEELQAAVNGSCSFRKVFCAYAAEYANNFGQEFKIDSLKFEKLQSPREYNFTTDRIFVSLSLEDAQWIYDTTDKAAFFKMAADMFTSRDGFSSFYNPDVKEWGEIGSWDANQMGCLLAAYAEDIKGDFDVYAELDLMEHTQCNGSITQWIEEATPDIARLYAQHEGKE
jgi:hypothetical protein